jgi:UDP-3-O-[3-hydroxymyristoyl] N-acetylglucosamine deacetylase
MFETRRRQATVSKEVVFSGVGVHSNVHSVVRVLPAEPNAGIVFKRADVSSKNNIIKLNVTNVVDSIMCTKIMNEDGVCITVVEHILAALRICEISNTVIEVDGEEIPIMDGSSAVFVDAFEKIGKKQQSEKVPAIIIQQPINHYYDNGFISVLPTNNQSIGIQLDYKRINLIKEADNSAFVKISDKDVLLSVARARTFGWLEDCEIIRQKGMALNASFENTIIVGYDSSILNDGGLAHQKEMVYHKILDLIGDFAVIGYDIIGEISGLNTSHLQNHLFLSKLMEELDKHTILS